MWTLFSTWWDTPSGTCMVFGFLLYGLITVWRKLSMKWNNWFPLFATIVRFTLYGFAIFVAIQGLQALSAGLLGFPNGLLACLGAALVPVINFGISSIRPKEKTRRGAHIGDPADVNKATASGLPKTEFKDSFSIGGVKVPRGAEPYHFFVVGSTGTGKSVAITNLIDHLESRGDIALVVDSGGGFCSRYFKEGRDHIINPFDDRCAPWSPTSEMAGPWDAEALAKSMIPDGVGDSKEWNAYAQTFVTSILRKLVEINRLSIKDLLYYAQAADMTELAKFLQGTPAAAQLVSDKTFGSIRTIATNYLATYAYLEDNDNPFSVAKFIKAEKPGFLFLTYRDDQLDSLRNLISCVLDVASRTILALPDGPNRRVWLIIDEFASIGKVQSIEAVATKARKKGGCLLLGLQSVSQLQDRYGDKPAQTILSCLSSWLVLRSSDVDTAEYISKYIGEAEISRMIRGESSSDNGGSDSLNEQIQTQRAIMPVELQRLANLTGFFKLAGDYPICRMKLAFPAKRPQRAQDYADRDFIARPMLSLTQDEQKKTTEPTVPVPPVAPAQATPSLLEEVPAAAPTPEPAPIVVKPRPAAKRLPLRKKTFTEQSPDILQTELTKIASAYANE